MELPLNDTVTGLAWSPQGDVLAASATLGTWLFDAVGFALTPRLLAVPNGPTHAAAFSPDGTLLATAHDDGTVRLWDVETGGQRAILRDHAGPVLALAFSPDGALLASGGGSAESGADHTIRLWDASTRALRVTLDGHTGPVRALAFSPDGTLIASASADGSIRLWDVISATPGTVLPADGDAALAVAFSPDGTRLAFAGEDGPARLRSLDSGGVDRSRGQGGWCTRARVLRDGILLVTAGGRADEESSSVLAFWEGRAASRSTRGDLVRDRTRRSPGWSLAWRYNAGLRDGRSRAQHHPDLGHRAVGTAAMATAPVTSAGRGSR